MRNGSFRAAFGSIAASFWLKKPVLMKEAPSERYVSINRFRYVCWSVAGLFDSRFAQGSSLLQANWAPAPAAVLASQAPLPIESTDSVAITNRIGSR
jgi:hypothetical protein